MKKHEILSILDRFSDDDEIIIYDARHDMEITEISDFARHFQFIGYAESRKRLCDIEIVDLNQHGVDCAMCGEYTMDRWAVPWYEEPVRSGESEGGYQAVCKPCYDKWEAWDSASSGEPNTRSS